MRFPQAIILAFNETKQIALVLLWEHFSDGKGLEHLSDGKNSLALEDWKSQESFKYRD